MSAKAKEKKKEDVVVVVVVEMKEWRTESLDGVGEGEGVVEGVEEGEVAAGGEDGGGGDALGLGGLEESGEEGILPQRLAQLRIHSQQTNPTRHCIHRHLRSQTLQMFSIS